MNAKIHTENIDEDGEVIFDAESNLPFVATYYQPCLGIRAANGYLRVFSDADGHQTETRIDHALMESAGWYLDADDLVGRAQMAETAMGAALNKALEALRMLRNAAIKHKMDKDDLEIEDADALLALESESHCEAAGTADEKPDGQAENVDVETSPPEPQ